MALPDSIITSQGDIIIPSNIARIASKFNTITLWTIDGFQITYTYDNAQLAQADFLLWQISLNTVFFGLPLNFISVSPNTSPVYASGPTLVFTGTGFLQFMPYCSLGTFVVIWDDGAGHVITSKPVLPSAVNATALSADFSNSLIGNPGTYTLYYSTNNSESRTSTGLNFVLTA